MDDDQARLLRLAFLLGAITDAAALVPMCSPSMASLLWGLDTTSAATRFAMGYGAALMLGWTVLLVWARARPLERKGVAAMTVLVIYGLVGAEVAAVARGAIAPWRLVPTWAIQAVLLATFATSYHWPLVRRWRGHFVAG